MKDSQDNPSKCAFQYGNDETCRYFSAHRSPFCIIHNPDLVAVVVNKPYLDMEPHTYTCNLPGCVARWLIAEGIAERVDDQFLRALAKKGTIRLQMFELWINSQVQYSGQI